MPSSPRREERRRPPAEARDWAELPRDVLLAILHRLSHFQILTSAGLVCRAWRGAAREEPELWRRIDVAVSLHGRLFTLTGLDRIARAAVELAAGECEAFSGAYLSGDFLIWLGDRVPSLKSLRLICCCNGFNEGLAKAMKKFALLEELELSPCSFVSWEVFNVVGEACPQLKRLRLG